MSARIGYLTFESLPPEMKSETIRLPDGRKLGLMQSGDPEGIPLLFFHGFGSSRLSVHPDEGIARVLGVHLISLDRPGIGLSDPKPGRSLLDWTDDVARVADALRIERFAVLGWSSGGPHALACAACLPARVITVGLAGSAAPFQGPAAPQYLPSNWQRIARTVRYVPWMLQPYFNRFSKQVRSDPQGVLAQSILDMVGPDREIASQPLFSALISHSAVEAYIQGGRGVLDDTIAICRPWGFSISDVRHRVLLWHGEQDPNWPAGMGHWLAQNLPECRAVFYPQDGHFAYLSHWTEILQALVMAS